MRVFEKLNTLWFRLSIFLFSAVISTAALADDGIIPVSSDEQIQSGESFIDVCKAILKENATFIEFGLATLIAVMAVVGLVHGYNKSVDEHNNKPLMATLTRVIIMVIFGGALIYLLQVVVKKV